MYAYHYFSETSPDFDPFSPFFPPSPFSKQSAGLLLFHLVVLTAAGSPLRMHSCTKYTCFASTLPEYVLMLRGTAGYCRKITISKLSLLWETNGGILRCRLMVCTYTVGRNDVLSLSIFEIINALFISSSSAL